MAEITDETPHVIYEPDISKIPLFKDDNSCKKTPSLAQAIAISR
jgi:hypothetical protein